MKVVGSHGEYCMPWIQDIRDQWRPGLQPELRPGFWVWRVPNDESRPTKSSLFEYINLKNVDKLCFMQRWEIYRWEKWARCSGENKVLDVIQRTLFDNQTLLTLKPTRIMFLLKRSLLKTHWIEAAFVCYLLNQSAPHEHLGETTTCRSPNSEGVVVIQQRILKKKQGFIQVWFYGCHSQRWFYGLTHPCCAWNEKTDPTYLW